MECAAERLGKTGNLGKLREWDGLIALALGLGLLGLYVSNGRMVGGGDVVPAMYLQVAIARGDGVVLDRFASHLRTPEGSYPGYCESEHDHVVSRYPIGPALLSAPWAIPQILWCDAVTPGWEYERASALKACRRMAKWSAAVLAALGMSGLFLALRFWGCTFLASMTATLATALASGQWTTASQGLWQHGPAVFCLAAALLMLAPQGSGAFRRASVLRLAVAGAAAGLMVVCRPVDLPFAAALALGVAYSFRDRRRLIAFFAPLALVATGYCAYNLYFFDHLQGGYTKIEQMHPWAHGTRGTFTGDLGGGLLGTLFSPSHGLLTYQPWVIIALALIPWSRRLWRPSPILRGLVISLIPTLWLLAKYSCWWGGHCFGARFWIDAGPIFAVLLAYGIDASRAWQSGIARGLLAVSLAIALVAGTAVHAVGAWCYPSSWHGAPTNADRDHARLWDWSDSELTRCWREGCRPREWEW